MISLTGVEVARGSVASGSRRAVASGSQSSARGSPRPGGLRVIALTPPGRFPTTSRDPGGWWPSLAADGIELERWSANAAWWRSLCSPFGVEAVLGPGIGLVHRLRRARLGRAALRAGAALELLTRPATFELPSRYVAAIIPVSRHLRLLGDARPGLSFSFEGGLEAAGVDYDSSLALVAAARADGPVTRLAELVADDYPVRAPGPGAEVGRDVLVVAVTSPQDLLLALAVVERLRRRGIRLHACLADHGHENFSLRPHLDRLRQAGSLGAIFDTIIEAKDERDVVVTGLVRALADGEAVEGFLTRRTPAIAARLDAPPAIAARLDAPPAGGPAGLLSIAPSASRFVPPPVPTFAPEPVLVTRLSARRCYWARCAFCIHNEKYDDRRVPSVAEVPAAVDALERWLAAGYRVVTLNDEALSPAILAALCEELERRSLPSRYPAFRWICRSRLETAFGPELFGRMRRAGCVEVLFGLESASSRVRGLMDKEVAGLDRALILSIVRAAGAAGLGVHLNVIAGFPGETGEELGETILLLAEALDGLPFATYQVNRFVVFPATPVARDPARFGIELAGSTGDMPALLPHRPVGEWALEGRAADALLPGLRADLDAALGWSWFARDQDRSATMRLVFGTGHGTLLKAHAVDLLAARPGRPAVA